MVLSHPCNVAACFLLGICAIGMGDCSRCAIIFRCLAHDEVLCQSTGQ